ncbi:MAG TPA: ankyrin repeat domain-containing protein [Thermoanaerobaculia bacterium]|nr:ankyrin repeat domain-containing protein [Thermoanaerobaculia bacterium]
MKKGCLVGLLTWAVCAGGYWYFLHSRFAAPLDIVVPVVTGFLMAMVVGNLRIALDSGMNAVRAGQQSTLVMGERPPDGKVITVSGNIRPTGAALRSPLTDRPAVLYEYDVNHTYTDSRGMHPAKDYVGYALTPAVIESRYGAIKLFGFPTLSGFGAEGNVETAKQYVARTQFEDMSGFDVVGVYGFVKDRLTNDSAEIRKDFRLSRDPQLDESASMTESVVAPGEYVTAMGRYSAEKGGLVQNADAPLSLARGDAAVSAAGLRTKASQALMTAFVLAAIVNGALFAVLKITHGKTIAMPKSAEQKRNDVVAVHEASRSGNTSAIQAAVTGGMAVDVRDSDGMTPLMRATDANTAAFLVAHGADVNAIDNDGETPLIVHADAGHTDVVKVLVKAGAKLDVRDPKYKMTALDRALGAERTDIVQVLRDAGAADATITAKNGRAIDEKSEPARVVMKYLDVMQRDDIAGLRAITTYAIGDPDFSAWKKTFPPSARVVSAFANDVASTVVIRGKRGDGTYATFTFQLAQADGAWKISGERWESRLDGKEP